MKQAVCEFDCKKSAKVETNTHNFATGDKRRILVCKSHLSTLLDTCHKDKIYITFHSLNEVQ